MPGNQLSLDTTAEAFEVQLACLRRMSPRERVRRTCIQSRRVRDMALNAIRRRHPDWDEFQVRLKFIELTHGKVLAAAIRETYAE